tara:strand:- start:26 stop:931 length:906 start_codon:yes stop_codon:yes gene_type:complete
MLFRFLFTILLICSLVFAQHRHLKKHDSNIAKNIKFVPANVSLENSYVDITTNSIHRLIKSNGIPNHKVGKFPNKGNPHFIIPQEYSFKLNLHPKNLKKPYLIHQNPTITGLPFGIAVNGVMFVPATAEYWNGNKKLGWNYCALGKGIHLGLDENYAHVQPNGSYHYHGVSKYFLDNIMLDKNKHSPIIGWAADGYPIYYVYGYNNEKKIINHKSGYQLKKGNRPIPPHGPGGKYDGTFVQDYEYKRGIGTLDECNGKFVVTPEYPEGTYAYFITENWPIIPRGFKGEFINLREKKLSYEN